MALRVGVRCRREAVPGTRPVGSLPTTRAFNLTIAPRIPLRTQRPCPDVWHPASGHRSGRSEPHPSHPECTTRPCGQRRAPFVPAPCRPFSIQDGPSSRCDVLRLNNLAVPTLRELDIAHDIVRSSGEPAQYPATPSARTRRSTPAPSRHRLCPVAAEGRPHPSAAHFEPYERVLISPDHSKGWLEAADRQQSFRGSSDPSRTSHLANDRGLGARFPAETTRISRRLSGGDRSGTPARIRVPVNHGRSASSSEPAVRVGLTADCRRCGRSLRL